MIEQIYVNVYFDFLYIGLFFPFYVNPDVSGLCQLITEIQ